MIEMVDYFETKGVENGVGDATRAASHQAEGVRVTMTQRPPLVELRRGGRHDRLHGRAGRPRRHARERLQDLLRRRHVRVRRHGPDRRAVRARPGDAPDRRLLHDGPARGGQGRRAARREAGRADALRHVPGCSSARPRGCATSSPSAGSRDVVVEEPSPGTRSNDLLARRVRPRGAPVGRVGRVQVPRRGGGRAVGAGRGRRRRDPELRERVATGRGRPGAAGGRGRARRTTLDRALAGTTRAGTSARSASSTPRRIARRSPGAECFEWAGGRTGPCYAAQGNILAGAAGGRGAGGHIRGHGGAAGRAAAGGARRGRRRGRRPPRAAVGVRHRPPRPAADTAATTTS